MIIILFILLKYLLWIISADPLPQEIQTPCTPSPCGANAICRELNGAGSCTCLPEYTGNPYEGCRPECIFDSDCQSDKSCVRNKCQNPCPGMCGQNAECSVINHLPSCSCLPGFIGDPFRFCRPEPIQRKKLFIYFLIFFILLIKKDFSIFYLNVI